MTFSSFDDLRIIRHASSVQLSVYLSICSSAQKLSMAFLSLHCHFAVVAVLLDRNAEVLQLLLR
jgi:hypothetical protein